MSEKVVLLYHFTCHHGYGGITNTGVLLPHIHPFAPSLGPLLWLTDVAAPSGEAVGLTSNLIQCNRMAYRYIVQTKAAVAWVNIRNRAPMHVVADMELFGEPEHWFVARRPLMASEFRLDDTWHAPLIEELMYLTPS